GPMPFGRKDGARIGISVVEIITQGAVVIRGKVRVSSLEAVIDDPDHDSRAAKVVPDVRDVNVRARGAAEGAGVAQVPLVHKERVVGDQLPLMLAGEQDFRRTNTRLRAQR